MWKIKKKGKRSAWNIYVEQSMLNSTRSVGKYSQFKTIEHSDTSFQYNNKHVRTSKDVFDCIWKMWKNMLFQLNPQLFNTKGKKKRARTIFSMYYRRYLSVKYKSRLLFKCILRGIGEMKWYFSLMFYFLIVYRRRASWCVYCMARHNRVFLFHFSLMFTFMKNQNETAQSQTIDLLLFWWKKISIASNGWEMEWFSSTCVYL